MVVVMDWLVLEGVVVTVVVVAVVIVGGEGEEEGGVRVMTLGLD